MDPIPCIPFHPFYSKVTQDLSMDPISCIPFQFYSKVTQDHSMAAVVTPPPDEHQPCLTWLLTPIP